LIRWVDSTKWWDWKSTQLLGCLNKDFVWAGLLQACCQPLCCSLLDEKLDGLPLQIHRSKPTLDVCVGLLTQFEHKPIPPRADAEARGRGPPLAADQKKEFY